MSSRVVAICKAADVARTRAWYEAAGFAVRPTAGSEDVGWLEVEREELLLLFLGGPTSWPSEPSYMGSFHVRVDDPERVASALAGLAEERWRMRDPSWGPREYTVQDPNG